MANSHHCTTAGEADETDPSKVSTADENHRGEVKSTLNPPPRWWNVPYGNTGSISSFKAPRYATSASRSIWDIIFTKLDQ